MSQPTSQLNQKPLLFQRADQHNSTQPCDGACSLVVSSVRMGEPMSGSGGGPISSTQAFCDSQSSALLMHGGSAIAILAAIFANLSCVFLCRIITCMRQKAGTVGLADQRA